MPSASLHGVDLAWSCEGLAIDPLGELFSMLDPVDLAFEGERRELRFTLRPATAAAAAADPRGEGWEPAFFHGIVQAYGGPGGFILSDRASQVRIPREGSPIDCEIAPRERDPLPGSAAAMLQIALTIALRTRRLYHLHAAALVHPSGAAVLVVGSSGAGKTTTTLALLESGYDYLGDDTLFLRASPRGVDLVAFPREFHLGPATLDAFPRLAPLAGAPSGRGDKRPVDPRRAYPEKHRAFLEITGAPLLALFPSVTTAATTGLAPIPRADAFGHLLASSAALVIEGVAGRDENLALLSALLGPARCFELSLGRDVLSGPTGAIGPSIERALASA